MDQIKGQPHQKSNFPSLYPLFLNNSLHYMSCTKKKKITLHLQKLCTNTIDGGNVSVATQKVCWGGCMPLCTSVCMCECWKSAMLTVNFSCVNVRGVIGNLYSRNFHLQLGIEDRGVPLHPKVKMPDRKRERKRTRLMDWSCPWAYQCVPTEVDTTHTKILLVWAKSE